MDAIVDEMMSTEESESYSSDESESSRCEWESESEERSAVGRGYKRECGWLVT